MASIRDLLKQIPGFAGGNLDDQLPQRALMDDDTRRALGQNRGRALGGGYDAPLVAPTATRERMVNTPPPASIRALMDARAGAPIATSETPESTPTMRAMQDTPYLNVDAAPVPFGSSGEPFQATRQRRVGMRDYVADDAQYLRDKEAQPLGILDKVLGIAGGLNANQRGEKGELTGRDRDIGRANRALGRDMAVQKQQTDAALKDLVPVQLDDGSTVMAPARSAGTLASQQQRVGQGADRLKQQASALESLKTRRKDMSTEQRGKLAMQVYNSGGANDPKILAQLSETLDLPADLKAKFNAGEVIPRVGDNGEIKLINKRDGSVVNTGVKDYETIKEAGRNTRQERAATAAMSRTQALIAAGIGKLGDPAVTESTAADLEDQAKDAEELAAELTEKGFPSQGAKALDRAVKLRDSITSLKEAANKARTAGAAGAPKGRTIEGAINAFKNNKKVNPTGRDPNAQEIANMKAKLDASR